VEFVWRYSIARPRKLPVVRKDLRDISYIGRVIADFVPNFVAMATGVGRSRNCVASLNLDRIATADVSVRVGDTVIQPCDRVRDLGVILDSSLSMRHHIAKVTSTCLFHLRRLRKIGHILDKNSRCRLVCAFIRTRIDYCNALYAELPDSTLAPLQRVLHAAVRFVVGLRARDHVTGALIELH